MRFTAVGPPFVVAASSFTFSDTTIAKGDYTYYVTRELSTIVESAPASLPADEPTRFEHHANWSTVRVRNQQVVDGHVLYSTLNKESQLAIVRWSRVEEPELVGYNIYRTCAWFPYEAVAYDLTQHHACEIGWVRLNTFPIPPGTREFYDSTTGGLQGTFLYAVRPVGPNGVEGPIGKVVAANLGMRGLSPIEIHKSAVQVWPIWTLNGAQSPPADSTPNYWRTIDYILNQDHPTANNDARAINKIERGTGDASAALPPPTAVTANIVERARNVVFEWGQTKFARVQWAMNNPPSDLLGFHIEAAGSPYGPWQRLTKHPLAWWERSYVIQGVSTALYYFNNTLIWSGHLNCQTYRVIAVDEDGNESATVLASNGSTACPATPEPPRNLRASSTSSGGHCVTRLEWDPSPGATEYHVYRYVFGFVATQFYDTKTNFGTLEIPPVTYYEEHGDDAEWHCSINSRDSCCGFPNGWEAEGWCHLQNLEAYYVTAVGPAGGGESPRSNLVTWSCPYASSGGHATNIGGPPPFDALASSDLTPAAESLACWNIPDAAREFVSEPPATLSTAPMLRLGVVDPQWGILDLHTDHLGTVRMISDSNGYMLSKHDYFPYGEEIYPQSSHNTHQFTGHERDRETGLDYMLARYYEAGGGRFISVDPANDHQLENPQSWSKYAYVRNNPLRAVDPTGQAEVVVNDSKQKQNFEQQLEETAGPGITLEDDTIKFDDTQLGSGTQYSDTARQGLKDLASPATKGTLVLDKSADPALATTGEGVTRGPGPGGAQGGDIVVVQVSGKAFGGLQDASGNPIAGPASIVLAHEILGHGLPGLKGMSGGNAVNTENTIRRELGLPTRKPEPGH